MCADTANVFPQVVVVVVYQHRDYGGKGFVAYSLFRHIGRAVLFGRYKDSLPMAVFTAYFDASGDRRMTVLTVAGFVAKTSKWNRFESEWATILKRYRVTFFHMTEFVSSNGEFSEWKGQTERRKKFVAALVKCMKKNTDACFVASVPMADYHDLNTRYEIEEVMGNPFSLCAGACLGGIQKWAKERNIDPKLILTFIENGDEGRGEFINRARIIGQKVIPLNKDDAKAFQAGDLVGWKSRTAIHKVNHASSLEDGLSAIRSIEPIKAMKEGNRVFDKEALQQLCEELPIRRRITSKITA